MKQLKADTKYCMNDYLIHLHSDVQQATERADSFFKRFNVINATEDLPFVPEYKCEGIFKMSEIFSISKEALPEENLFDDIQVKQLTKKVERLWNAYHFFADFPNAVQPREKYRLMRDKWDCDVKLASRGETHIEFCHHGPGNCQFKGYCTICSDLKDEE